MQQHSQLAAYFQTNVFCRKITFYQTVSLVSFFLFKYMRHGTLCRVRAYFHCIIGTTWTNNNNNNMCAGIYGTIKIDLITKSPYMHFNECVCLQLCLAWLWIIIQLLHSTKLQVLQWFACEICYNNTYIDSWNSHLNNINHLNITKIYI